MCEYGFPSTPHLIDLHMMASSLDILGQRFGNHVGDWEHTMIRFVNGSPDIIYYSAHSGGAAYKYNHTDVTWIGNRPVSYTAIGTHANYAVCLHSPTIVSPLITGVPRHRAIGITRRAFCQTRRVMDPCGILP
jgi:hypothetical protein